MLYPVIKINAEEIQQRIAATQQIANALKPYRDLAREKSIAFIVMGASESMDILSEEEMNRMGWFKKEKSLIVNPFSK